MKVLLIHNRYRYAGGEDQVFYREGQLLRSKGHRVLEYTRDNAEIADAGILSKAQLAIQTAWARDTHRDLRSLLLREKPDVAHFHNTFPLVSPSALYACSETATPVVLSLHNARLLCPGGGFYRDGRACQDCARRLVPWPAILHSCYRNSMSQTAVVAGMTTLHRLLGTWRAKVDAYIVFTEFFREKFVAAGLPRRKVFLKPHFLINDPGLRQLQGEYALYVGRLVPEKGLSTLLEAWRLLGNPLPLRIVGDGPNRTTFEASKEKARLSNVSFDGWLPSERLQSVMKKAAFLVFPSEFYETFGLAVIEAFASGVPVIASRMGALPEIVENGKTGLHFTPANARDLADKVEWACTHASEMAAMGRAARAQYEAKYTAERNYQLLMEIYAHAERATARKAA